MEALHTLLNQRERRLTVANHHVAGAKVQLNSNMHVTIDEWGGDDAGRIREKRNE